MSEIIQLISYENNERLGSNCLADQNDHWNPICLKIDRPVYSLGLFQSMRKQCSAVSLTNSMTACLV